MPTWVRLGTGTAPTSTDVNLTGSYALDNATAPGDFDAAAVTSVRCQWTITGTSFGADDTWDDDAGVALVTSGAVELSQHVGDATTGNGNVGVSVDKTDSAGIPTGETAAAWESAAVRGDGTVTPDEWCTYQKLKGPDGGVLTASALTVTITYTRAATDYTEFPTDAVGILDPFATAKTIPVVVTDAVGILDTVETALITTKKLDVPFRLGGSKLRTTTVALRGDQWGKYLVPQLPWVNGMSLTAPTAPEGLVRDCAFSPDGRFLAVGHGTSPYITVYDRSGPTFTKVSALTAPEGVGYGCAWSPDGRFLAVAHATSPGITVYERDGTTFTKVSALTAVEGNGDGCAWSPDGRFLAVAHDTTPHHTVYERDDTTFTKVSALAGTGNNEKDCDFSPDGRFLAFAGADSPYVTVYERANTTFTKVSALTAPEGSADDCKFSPDGRFLAVAHGTSPYITVYERDDTTFTKVSALPAGNGSGTGCGWTLDGRYLAVSSSTGGAPYMDIYERFGTTFTKAQAMADLGSQALACAWSPDGRFLCAGHVTTPYITVFETSGLTPREGYLWMQDPGER